MLFPSGESGHFPHEFIDMSKIDFDDGAADPTAEDLAFLECLVGRPGQPKRLGTSGGRRLKRGEYWIIQQPGDGKCLFHSLSEGEWPWCSEFLLCVWR